MLLLCGCCCCCCLLKKMNKLFFSASLAGFKYFFFVFFVFFCFCWNLFSFLTHFENNYLPAKAIDVYVLGWLLFDFFLSRRGLNDLNVGHMFMELVGAGWLALLLFEEHGYLANHCQLSLDGLLLLCLITGLIQTN